MNRHGEVRSAVDSLTAKERDVCIAIDGRCASGKTTYANLLAAAYGASIIHMDDFFLPGSLRTPERYAEPGGNVHYERFLEEAAVGLKSGKAFSYRRFDCQRMDYGGSVEITLPGIVIVEGAYCMRPEFRALYSLSIFMDVDAEEQLRRIEQRDGASACRMFRERWIPYEEKYIEAFDVMNSCDFIMGTAF